MPFKSYKDESRANWGTNLETGQQMQTDMIQLGAILRIADAVELMARRYNELISDCNWHKARAERLDTELTMALRSNRALRGQITKLRKRKID